MAQMGCAGWGLPANVFLGYCLFIGSVWPQDVPSPTLQSAPAPQKFQTSGPEVRPRAREPAGRLRSPGRFCRSLGLVPRRALLAASVSRRGRI